MIVHCIIGTELPANKERTKMGKMDTLEQFSRKQDKYGIPGSILPEPYVTINTRTFLDMYLYPMAISGL